MSSLAKMIEAKRERRRAGTQEGAPHAAPDDVSQDAPHAAPEHVPDDVWQVMQENGRQATQRLQELLTSARFHRLKTSDQARLIALAQERAYGKPDPGVKRSVKVHAHVSDATALALAKAADRTRLPEYRGPTHPEREAATSEPLRGSEATAPDA